MRGLLIFLLLLLSAPAAAQFERSTASKCRAGTPSSPSWWSIPARSRAAQLDLAILMRTKPGWHGYWLNPGDAGLPMSVEWQLPPGWSVGPLRYPVPSRLLVSGIVNYVYEKDYAVLTRLKAPAGATGSHRISAKMRWLACTTSVCVPEQGEVELDVTVGGKAATRSALQPVAAGASAAAGDDRCLPIDGRHLPGRDPAAAQRRADRSLCFSNRR